MCALSSRVAEDGVRSVTPVQGSSSSLSGLAAPSLGPLALLSKLQSSFKNKEPLRPIRLSRRTPHRQCVTNSTLTLSWPIPFFFFFIFLSFHIHFFFFTSALTFGEFSQLFPASLPVFFFYIFPHYSFFFSSPSVVLFFCFSLLISMVTVHFPGIMGAGGLEGVKADGWLSHK